MSDRILIMIKGLGRGGAEQLLLAAAPYLDTDRFDYEIAYVLPEKDALVDQLRAAGVPVTCLGDAGTGRWVPRLRRLIRHREIALVHSHLPYAGIGARIGPSRGVRSVYTEHNLWESYHPATRWANLVTFGRNDHVFAVSDRVRASIAYPPAMRTVLRMPPVETLYHGIDQRSVEGWSRVDGVRAEFGIPTGIPVVGTVANFRTEKDLGTLVRAAELVRREIPDVRVILVGQGPTEPDVRRLAHDLDLDRTVTFAGYRTDAPRIASSFDVFAMSSVHEGLPIALIEAMALGKSAVVTDAGGVSEVVEDGEQGIVVPPRDPGLLASGLVRILRDPELRCRYGEAARRRARSFDIRTTVARMEDVYEELLS
jgi:glycosyltransferase involved in cell wall biosynthesis